MAMEDAVALSQALATSPGDLAAALAAYEDAAQPSVTKIQNSARPSLAWWEHFGRYYDEFEPWQFAYHFLSRSISDGRLARRAPTFVESTHRRWTERYGAEPLQTPFSNAGWSNPTRIVEVRIGADGPISATGSAHTLPLADANIVGAPWGARLAAPLSEAELPATFAKLADLAHDGPVLLAVNGGTPLTRTLLCEQARMQHQLPALLVEDTLDDDLAVTAVLSGRADLVGAPAVSAGHIELVLA
jgi:anthraniloyl-CoA monooxygenase